MAETNSLIGYAISEDRHRFVKIDRASFVVVVPQSVADCE